jgi:hypothetical protein
MLSQLVTPKARRRDKRGGQQPVAGARRTAVKKQPQASASGARLPAAGSMRAVPGCDGECEVDDERVRFRLV